MTFFEQLLLALPLAIFSIGILEVYSRGVQHVHVGFFRLVIYITSVALFMFLPLYGLQLSFEASNYDQNESDRLAVILIWLAGVIIYILRNWKVIKVRLKKNH